MAKRPTSGSSDRSRDSTIPANLFGYLTALSRASRNRADSGLPCQARLSNSATGLERCLSDYLDYSIQPERGPRYRRLVLQSIGLAISVYDRHGATPSEQDRATGYSMEEDVVRPLPHFDHLRNRLSERCRFRRTPSRASAVAGQQ